MRSALKTPKSRIPQARSAKSLKSNGSLEALRLKDTRVQKKKMSAGLCDPLQAWPRRLAEATGAPKTCQKQGLGFGV